MVNYSHNSLILYELVSLVLCDHAVTLQLSPCIVMIDPKTRVNFLMNSYLHVLEYIAQAEIYWDGWLSY